MIGYSDCLSLENKMWLKKKLLRVTYESEIP